MPIRIRSVAGRNEFGILKGTGFTRVATTSCSAIRDDCFRVAMTPHRAGFGRRFRLSWASPGVFAGSFALLILAGSLLLWLPVSVRGPGLPYLDALFQSTSAVCVTGLATVDIGTRLSLAGQWVILALIQIGGLGIMTYSLLLVTIVQRSGSPDQSEWLANVFTSDRRLPPRRMLRWIFLVTAVCEAVGALLLTFAFLRQHQQLSDAAFDGVFHAVSAFCNAGFSTFSYSLLPFRDDLLVNVIVMVLIVTGGLGFIVTFELWRLVTGRRRWFKLLLQTKLVLFATLILILSGAVAIFVLEMYGVFGGLGLKSRVLASLFQSVTARTAGFNTVDIAALSNDTLMILIVLMFIGAAPGSCAGGVKVTTVGVLVLSVFARIHDRPKPEAWNRSVPGDTIARAAALFFGAMLLIAVGTLALQLTELAGVTVEASRAKFLPLLFEVTSAFGTVGLSTGITPTLTPAGKIVIIGIMFVGRVGPLTLAATLIGKASRRRAALMYPEEDLMIG